MMEAKVKALEHERRLSRARGEQALEYARAAAELYMQVAERAALQERKLLVAKIKELIDLAELLKRNPANPATTKRPSLPISTRERTRTEEIVVLRASRLHGNTFPPWKDPPDEEFSRASCPEGVYMCVKDVTLTNKTPLTDLKGLLSDDTAFTLSHEQQTTFSGWRRAAELVPRTENGSLENDAKQLMAANSDLDLAQDLASDCSVVASLCAAARYFSPGPGSLLGSLMYPYNHELMRPDVSENGKYAFRMYFNGTWRRVTIDDRLPSSSTDRTLYVVDRRNPRLIWPALVEKAYLKIRGGYDFPGSNSGTDLYALTGWIPEQIFLQSDDFELDDTWDRIKKAYDEGDAILTLGTGNILPEEEQALGLVKEHDYAVLDVKVEAESRLLLVKNPWVDSLVWTGIGSSATLQAHTVGSTSEGQSNQFWMAFEDVLQHFDSLYVNWNPALFLYRQDHHFKWDIPDSTEQLVYTRNPQFSILSPSKSSVWVLLSRHWQDGELDILRARRSERDHHGLSLAAVSKQLGFMSLSIFASTPPGTRIPLADGHHCLHQGPYVDSPNTLLRYTPTPNIAQTLVVTQSELPLPSYSFTLSFFSLDPLTINPADEPLKHTTTVSGAWTRRTAGGSAAHATYFTNPQYALTLTSSSQLTLVLSTSSRDLPVHIALIFSPQTALRGRCITSLHGRDILSASPEYQRGCTFLSVPLLDAGIYTVVLSTYEPGQTGQFTLRVSADAEIALSPLLADSAGMLRTPAPKPAVFRSSGEHRLRMRLSVVRLTRLCILARSGAPPAASELPMFSSSGHRPALGPDSCITSGTAIRISLELGTGPHRKVLAMSGRSLHTNDGNIDHNEEGEFADATMGLCTGEADVDPELVRAYGPGGLWVVVERIGGGTVTGDGDVAGNSTERGLHEGVYVEVLSDGAVQFGKVWENADE